MEDLLAEQKEQLQEQSQPERPSISNTLTEETRLQKQRTYKAQYRKRKREQERLLAQQPQLLAQQQYSMQQQQYHILQQLQHSTRQQELGERQAEQQEHAGTAELPMQHHTLTKETRMQKRRRYQAEYRRRKREQEQLLAQQPQLLAQQQYSMQQQQYHIQQQFQHSIRQQELEEGQSQQQHHAGTTGLPMQPSISNSLIKETRMQKQRRYHVEYRKRKKEREQLLAQQHPIQQPLQNSTQQPLQHSTQQLALEDHQALQLHHAGTAGLPMQPSISNSLIKETRMQKQRRYQAEYRQRKREREQSLAQQHPIQQQPQHSTEQQELEEHQTQQQHAGTAEHSMQPSTSNVLNAENATSQIHTTHQEGCRKREQEQLLAQQQNIEQQSQQQAQEQQHAKTASYMHFSDHIPAHRQFHLKFTDNHFGYACVVCDRLWFSRDLKSIPLVCRNLIHSEFPDLDFDNARVCGTCYLTLKTNKIPQLSKSNGFKYPSRPLHLPQLDILTERLVSPRLPFMQIRRLRHGQGQNEILGQIINVPVSINNMMQLLPRNIDDDFAINVHIQKKLIHKSSYLVGLVKKNVIKDWLQYLIESPLYKFYNIEVNNEFFMDESIELQTTEQKNLSEAIDIEESLLAQQQTLLWNEDQYSSLAPGLNNDPGSILFDEHCEELSFPSIYLGEFRNFKEGLTVTPFMIAKSELLRSDRRGVTPSHLLYMAMKIMRLHVRDSNAFKYNISRNEVQNEHYLNGCIEKNLAFLCSIPNSIYYWSQRKRDLFAMIRQLGKPTLFLTMSANEIGWPQLIKILYKLKHNTELQETELQSMHFNDKATLVNDDPVTCAIHFNKIVNVILSLLQSLRYSPFGKNYVRHFFKRIEFQHGGSPHAHILLWLNEAPNDAMGANMSDAVNLIDKLVSVDASNCSGMQELQTHKHTVTCNKNDNYSRSTGQNCRLGAPFMPSKATSILIPMPLTDARRSTLHKIYLRMWKALEENDYENMDTFLAAHNVKSEETYLDILRAGITRPMVILKRETSEKWIIPFNPFILYVLRSNMDIQFITEEYSCADYVVEYVNKTNRGISNLQQNINKLMDEHPEFDISEITRHLGENFLNSVELTCQESAWYLLRQPMSESSVQIIYIPTSWPTERERIKETNAELLQDETDGESCDMWKENVFDKYEKRPVNLENISLAQFTSRHTYHKGEWKLRQQPRIIRFRNYDVTTEQNNYKREMVTLHLAFRDEENDLLAEQKYLQLYDENFVLIMERRKEFESSFDIAKTLAICRNMCSEYNDVNVQVEGDVNVLGVNVADNDGFADFLHDPNEEINADIRVATLSRLGSLAEKRDDNTKQKGLLLHVIANIIDHNDNAPIQFFMEGPAGCGKIFVIHLLKEIYNRYSHTQGFCNAFLTCAPTGKAAAAINGTRIHTAFKIAIARNSALSLETLQQSRSQLKNIVSIIIDEISISAKLKEKIDVRLTQITANNEIYGDSIRNERSILKSVTSIVDGTLSLGTQRLEQIHFLEMVMYEYLERTLYHNIPVEDANFQKKAEEVKDCMAILKFKPSYEWLIYFKKKYGLKDFSKETLRIRLQLKEEKRSSLDPVDMVRYVQQQRRILHKSQRNVPTYINQTQVRDYTRRPKTYKSMQQLKKDNNPTIVYEGADEDSVHSDVAVDGVTVKLEIAPTQLSEYNGPHPISQNITIAVPIDPKTNDNQQDDSDDEKLSPQKSDVHDIILESESEDDEYLTIYEIIDDEAPSSPVADNHRCYSSPSPSNVENYTQDTDKHNFITSVSNVKNSSQEGDISRNIGDSITIKTEPPSNDDEQVDTNDKQTSTYILPKDDVIIKTEASPSPLIDEKDISTTSGLEESVNYVMGHTQAHSNSSSLPPADELDEDIKPTIIVNNGEELIIENKNGATDHHHPSSSVPCKRNRPNSPLPDIDTLEEAMRYLKALENYVMLKENFRAIGLITQLEDAIKKTPKQ